MDFDPETFAPRYRLIYRSIAPSLGLEMARRLGFPPALLDAAERERSRLGIDLATAAAALEAERRGYEEKARAAVSERTALEADHARYAELLNELQAQKKRRWADELGEARRFADELRREGQRMLDEARQRPQELGRQATRGGSGAADEHRRARARAVRPTDPADSETPGGGGAAPRIGDEVQVIGSGLRGRLESISGARAQLSRGSIRFDVPIAQLRRLPGVASGARPVRTTVTHAVTPQAARGEASPEVGLPGLALLELNLVGARVQHGLAQLESFLDRATLESVGVVRIIHGMGTGALRDAVREYLDRSPYVSRFAQADRREGGAGATIAYLR